MKITVECPCGARTVAEFTAADSHTAIMEYACGWAKAHEGHGASHPSAAEIYRDAGRWQRIRRVLNRIIETEDDLGEFARLAEAALRGVEKHHA